MSETTTLTPAVAPGGLLPFGMQVIPGTKAILVSDPGLGAGIYDFTHGAPATSTPLNIPGHDLPCWAIFSKETGTYFLTDFGNNNLYEVSIDTKLRGKYLQTYPTKNFSTPTDIAIGTIHGQESVICNKAMIHMFTHLPPDTFTS